MPYLSAAQSKSGRSSDKKEVKEVFNWVDDYLFIETNGVDSIPYLLEVSKNKDALLSYTEPMGTYTLEGYVFQDSSNKLEFFLYEELEGFEMSDSLPLISFTKTGEVILTSWGSFRPQYFEPIDSMVYFKRKFDVIDHFTKYIGEYPFESKLFEEPWLDYSLKTTLRNDYLSIFSFMRTVDEIYEADSMIMFEGLSVDKSGLGPSGRVLVCIDRWQSDLIVAFFDDFGRIQVITKRFGRDVPAIVNEWIEDNRIKEDD